MQYSSLFLALLSLAHSPFSQSKYPCFLKAPDVTAPMFQDVGATRCVLLQNNNAFAGSFRPAFNVFHSNIASFHCLIMDLVVSYLVLAVINNDFAWLHGRASIVLCFNDFRFRTFALLIAAILITLLFRG